MNNCMLLVVTLQQWSPFLVFIPSRVDVHIFYKTAHQQLIWTRTKDGVHVTSQWINGTFHTECLFLQTVTQRF